MGEAAPDRPLRLISVDRAYFRRISYALMGALLLGVLALLLIEAAWSEKNFWAVAVVGLGIFPFIRWFYRAMAGVLPIFELHALFYASCYGLSSMLMGLGASPVSDTQRTLALQGTFVGLLAMYAAYYFAGPTFFSNDGRLKIKTRLQPEKILRSAWIIAFIGFGSTNILRFVLGNFSGLVSQLLTHLALFSVALIFVHLVVTRNISVRTWLSFALLMSLWLISTFASGFIGPILTPWVLCSLVLLNVKKKFYFKINFFLLIIMVVLNTAKYEVRRVTWGGGALKDASSLTKDKLFLNFFMKNLNLKNVFTPSGLLHNFAVRIDHGGLLATVMSMSPDPVPFKDGVTYTPLATVWIPRVLWPGKPADDFGNTWAHWYGLLDPGDRSSSYNLPWLVEFFMNFGWLGIVFGMFLTGLLYSWLSVYLCDEEATAVEYAAGLSLLAGFWFAESSLSLMWGGLIIGGISIFVFLKVISYATSET